VAERDKSLEETFTKIKEENGQVESTLDGFTEEYSRKADDFMMRNQELGVSLEKKGEQCKRLRDGALKVILASLLSTGLLTSHAVPRQCQRRGPRRCFEYADPGHNIPINILH
jgi:hypothetical protein